MEDFEMEFQVTDAEEVEKSLWMKLVERGYIPTDMEMQDLMDILQEILFEYGFIDEVVEGYEEE